MVKLGFFFTGYLFISLAIFLLLSFTINGWIVYGLFLLPFYGLVLIVGWLRLLKHRHQTARFKPGVWLTVMALQMGVVLTSLRQLLHGEAGGELLLKSSDLFW